jgi:hypothetical protein
MGSSPRVQERAGTPFGVERIQRRLATMQIGVCLNSFLRRRDESSTAAPPGPRRERCSAGDKSAKYPTAVTRPAGTSSGTETSSACSATCEPNGGLRPVQSTLLPTFARGPHRPRGIAPGSRFPFHGPPKRGSAVTSRASEKGSQETAPFQAPEDRRLLRRPKYRPIPQRGVPDIDWA